MTHVDQTEQNEPTEQVEAQKSKSRLGECIMTCIDAILLAFIVW